MLIYYRPTTCAIVLTNQRTLVPKVRHLAGLVIPTYVTILSPSRLSPKKFMSEDL
jgi:hypothetical protein